MRTAIKRALAVATGGGIALAPVLVPGVASAQRAPHTVYVSPTGTPGAADTSCDTAAYSVINDAIAEVATRGTVTVCEGTYHQTATVDKTLTLMGRSGAVIDGAELGNFDIEVTADGVTVRGLTVEHGGTGVGVYAEHVTIVGNKFLDNNEAHPGAGIHVARSYARVSDNTVEGAGGCGITLGEGGALNPGPAVAHVQVVGNHVEGTLALAGICLGSHIGGGGTFDNVIRGNVITGSIPAPDAPCHQGGAGVLLGSGLFFTLVFCQESSSPTASGSPPTGNVSGVHNNLVTGNRISGNAWPGVFVVGAVPDSSQNMNGNVITANQMGTNNLSGTSLTFIPTEVMDPTGVLVASPTPLSIQVVGNTISDNHYGIWKNSLITARGLNSNRYINVTEPVYTYAGG